MQKHHMRSCSTVSYFCDNYADNFDSMVCVLMRMINNQVMDLACNGGNYALMVTTGSWSYNGYSGTITSASDDRDVGADCVAMCTK